MADPPEPGKMGRKKRKRNNAPLPADPDAHEQSAGIKNILRHFRSTQAGFNAAVNASKHNSEDVASGSVAAATDLGDRTKATLADAGVLESGTALDGNPAGVSQTASEELPASKSNCRDIESRDAEHADAPPQKKQPSAAVLPWMRLPVSIEPGQGVQLGGVGGLDPRLRDKLKADGFVELYPVQAAAWRITAGGRSALNDVCISAPTGSGKTLAYALPIIQGLLGRCAPRLRCLVVLPTRDLAAQVFRVFAGLCPAAGLRAALAAAQASVAAEAAEAFGGHLEAPCPGMEGLAGPRHTPVDILVATPGRLMAHLRGTPGVSLEHLRYLVVDEADRLLRQAYQDWLPFVVAAAGADSLQHGASLEGPGSRVLKFVASATLTRDPAKIGRLGLHCPRYLALEAADKRHAVPKSLKEYKLVCTGADKPLHAVALLRQLAAEPTIIFTASVEATRRLYVLLSGVPDLAAKAVEFSSLNTAAERSAALAAFNSGKASLLVASDAMTRGMDLPSVAAVVNYDAPVYPKTYVHRAGRTARAGRAGRVFTILRREEVRHFKGLLHKVSNTYVKDHRLPLELLEAARPASVHALEILQAYLQAE